MKKAAEYIQVMRRKNSLHQQDIDDLKKQNKVLEEQSEYFKNTSISFLFLIITFIFVIEEKEATYTQFIIIFCLLFDNLLLILLLFHEVVRALEKVKSSGFSGTSILESKPKSESISSFEGMSDSESSEADANGNNGSNPNLSAIGPPNKRCKLSTTRSN